MVHQKCLLIEIMNNSGLSNRVKKVHMQQLADYRKELRNNPQLRSLFIEMTGLCNEHCRHCGSSCGDYEVSNTLAFDEICHVLDTVKEDFDIDKMTLCITGGEPLLRPDFFEIMNYAKELGFKWGMTSNGILIDKECAKKLHAAGMQTISISVDGLRETHDWFRQLDGSYDRTMEGIHNLIEENGFNHVQITTVVHHRNISELEEMYKEFRKTGVRSWRVINIEPIGRAKQDPELLLSNDEYKQVFNFIREKRLLDPHFTVTYGCSHYLGVEMERELRQWYFLCNAGVYTASVMYNGDVGACLDIERRPETIQGNIRDRRLSEIWKQEFQIFRSDYRKCNECAKCDDYEFCAGDSYHTWDFDEMKPQVCMKTVLQER